MNCDVIKLPVPAETPLDVGAELRKVVHRMEDVIRTGTPVECPVTHHFAHGTYGREMLMPKGTILTGKIHKFSQLNILSKGDVSVLLHDGWKRVKAGYHVVAPAGAKRLFYAHEDSVWTVIHATEETDVERIEETFIAQSEAEFLAFCEQQRTIEGPMKPKLEQES